MMRMLGGFLLLAISSTAMAASNGRPTVTDMDLLTNQILAAKPIPTQKLKELFSSDSHYTADCYTSDIAFGPVPRPQDVKTKSPDSATWSPYSMGISTEMKVPLENILTGEVSFTLTEMGRHGFNITSSLSLKNNNTEVKYLRAVNARLACEFDTDHLCGAVIGGLTHEEMDSREILQDSEVQKNDLLGATSDGNFGIYSVSDDGGALIMRIASKISAQKKGVRLAAGATADYIVRYICTLTRAQ